MGASLNAPHRDTFYVQCQSGTSFNEAHPGAQASRPHKAWHDRGYLPHFDEAGTVQFLTLTSRTGRPPGSAGVPPAFDVARRQRTSHQRAWCALQGMAVAGRLFAAMRCGRDPPRAPPRPSPSRSRRQRRRVLLRRETERHDTPLHAGETPALPGGASSQGSASAEPIPFLSAASPGASSQGN